MKDFAHHSIGRKKMETNLIWRKREESRKRISSLEVTQWVQVLCREDKAPKVKTVLIIKSRAMGLYKERL